MLKNAKTNPTNLKIPLKDQNPNHSSLNNSFVPPKPKQVESSRDLREFYKNVISAKNPYLQNPNNSPLRPPLSPSPNTKIKGKRDSIAPEISYMKSSKKRRSYNTDRDNFSKSKSSNVSGRKSSRDGVFSEEKNNFEKLKKIENLKNLRKNSKNEKSAKKRDFSSEKNQKNVLIKSDRKSVNILKSIFLVKEKDDANTVSLKNLRNQINTLREKDEKFKQSYLEKLQKLQSTSYLQEILKKCQNSKNEILAKSEISFIQNKLNQLEDIWNTLFTSYEQRLYLLTKIMSTKDENYSDFLLRLKTNISLEIDFLTDKINSKKLLLDLLNEREKVKIVIYEASRRYKTQSELKDMVDEVKDSLFKLKNLNLKILGEIEKMKKNGVKESEMKVYGIKFELLARIDIWEEDYMRKIADGKL